MLMYFDPQGFKFALLKTWGNYNHVFLLSILNILELTFGLDLIFFESLVVLPAFSGATIFKADFGAVWTQESHPTA